MSMGIKFLENDTNIDGGGVLFYVRDSLIDVK